MTVGEAFFAYLERRRWPVLALVLGLSAVCVYLEGERKVSASIWEIFDKERPVNPPPLRTRLHRHAHPNRSRNPDEPEFSYDRNPSQATAARASH